jgi:hypothetical protein
MPITAIALLSLCDMACSLTLAPLASFACWRGWSTAGPFHYRTYGANRWRLIWRWLTPRLQPLVPSSLWHCDLLHACPLRRVASFVLSARRTPCSVRHQAKERQMIRTINRVGTMSWFIRSTARPRGATTEAFGRSPPNHSQPARMVAWFWPRSDVPLNPRGDRT